MAIHFRHLHAFRQAARLGTISAAARSSHLSQPALTQAIAGVENFFGTKLLQRGSRGVVLTEAGRLCLKRIERSLAQIRDGLAEIDQTERRGDLIRSLNVSQLDALAAVVEHRTFSAAARARGLAQPTVYRSARELERMIRIPLFEKTSFGVVPTLAASRLARRIKLAFAELEQARAEVAALFGGESGVTVIGAMPLARTYLIPTALIAFTREYPKHRVGIVEGTYENLIDGLKSGEIDFLVGAMRDAKSLVKVVQEPLFDDPLSIVVRTGHPLTKKNQLTVHALLGYPWIAPRASSPLREQFNALFKTAGFTPPRTAIECNSLAAARAVLIESDHIMLLSAHQIHYELSMGVLAALPHPAGKVTRSIGLTFREDWQPTLAQEQLLRLVKQKAHGGEMPVSRKGVTAIASSD
jgi:LysR family transcriptional regulator of gallate degradation